MWTGAMYFDIRAWDSKVAQKIADSIGEKMVKTLKETRRIDADWFRSGVRTIKRSSQKERGMYTIWVNVHY